MRRPPAKGTALAMTGLLILSNLLTTVFEVEGTAWFVLRLLMAGALAGALIGVVGGWLLKRRSGVDPADSVPGNW